MLKAVKFTSMRGGGNLTGSAFRAAATVLGITETEPSPASIEAEKPEPALRLANAFQPQIERSRAGISQHTGA
jgi:hypothetical protein